MWDIRKNIFSPQKYGYVFRVPELHAQMKVYFRVGQHATIFFIIFRFERKEL